MRRLVSASLSAAALVALGAPAALAHGFDATAFGVPDPTADFQSSANVSHVLRLPQHRGTGGGRLVGDRFYLTDQLGVHVYDVSDPLAPAHLGSITVFQTTSTTPAFGQEDPDTNGRILLLDGANPFDLDPGSLQIVDVSDPAEMSVLAKVPETAHTWTCVADCTYAYGRDGEIVDLHDPANPVLLPQQWHDASGTPSYVHDLSEVAPGRVFTAGGPSTYLDVTDPTDPLPIAEIRPHFQDRGYHGVEWAREGRDSIVVLGTEDAPDNAGGECKGDQSIIATYGTTSVLAEEDARTGDRPVDATFELLDEWRVAGRGIGVDGQAPGHVLFCAHWFEPHPDWQDGGLLAAGYYDWGTRIIDVASDGTMSELGWYLPSDGYTSAAYWISSDVVYVHDYVRGLEVLKIDLEAPADPSPEGQVAAGTMDFEDLPDPAAAQDVPVTPVTGSGMVGMAVGTLGLGWGLRRRRAG